MGRYDVLIEGSKSMLARGLVSLLAVASPAAAMEFVTVRSNRGGTLSDAIEALKAAAIPPQEEMIAVGVTR